LVEKNVPLGERGLLASGYLGPIIEEAFDNGDLIRLAAATEVLLSIAERVDADLVGEALLADLIELRERAESALRLPRG
jgi:hypothetical protein